METTASIIAFSIRLPGRGSLVVFDWEFCAQSRGTYDVATFISEAFPPQQRRNEELGLLRTYHSILVSNGVTDYPFEECLSGLPAFDAGSLCLLDNHGRLQ